MKNNHKTVIHTGTKAITVEFTNERIIPASGLSVVGALLQVYFYRGGTDKK